MTPIEERMTALEALIPHLATKADLANLKVWMLLTHLGAIGLIVGLLRWLS